MDHIVHPAKGAVETFPVAHIADKVTQTGMFFRRKPLRHLKLLEFVAGKNDEPFGLAGLKDHLHAFLPKDPVPPVIRIVALVNI